MWSTRYLVIPVFCGFSVVSYGVLRFSAGRINVTNTHLFLTPRRCDETIYHEPLIITAHSWLRHSRHRHFSGLAVVGLNVRSIIDYVQSEFSTKVVYQLYRLFSEKPAIPQLSRFLSHTIITKLTICQKVIHNNFRFCSFTST